jgi:hypothetical protein
MGMKLPAASSGVSPQGLCFFRRKRRGIYPERLNQALILGET